MRKSSVRGKVKTNESFSSRIHRIIYERYKRNERYEKYDLKRGLKTFGLSSDARTVWEDRQEIEQRNWAVIRMTQWRRAQDPVPLSPYEKKQSNMNNRPAVR